jgi:heat shock protein HslJ
MPSPRALARMLFAVALAAAVAGCVATPPGRDPAPPARALENTYWKLVALHGEPSAPPDRQPEAHLILQPAQQRVVGSGGCNRLTGSYTLDGERLGLGRTAATRMACAQGMAQEQRFLDTLGTVAAWRVRGQRLDLLDAQRRVVAEFVAVDLR